MSNVDTEGFCRKELQYTTQIVGGLGCGLIPVGIKRYTDMFKTEQMRVMTSDVSSLETLTSYYTDLNQQLGQPGENNALTSYVNDFKKNIELLVARPEVVGSRSALLFSAQTLAQELGALSTVAQSARSMADGAINSSVLDVNNILTNLNNINSQIALLNSQGLPTAELLDQRDHNLTQLSENMDCRVQYGENDTVSIYTNGGLSLLQSSLNQLTFNTSPGLTAAASYASGTLNGILINGNPALDITPTITGGKLGALIQLRDVELPAFQASLDQLTGMLRDQINAIHNCGTASQVPQSLAGNRTGQTMGDNIVGSGTVAVAVVDRATGKLVENTIINLSTIGTLGGVINQINGMANATANLDANGALHIQTSNPNYGISIASTSVPAATITSGAASYGFSHYYGLNDFFVTPGTQLGVAAGISGVLAVNSNIVNDLGLIANTALNITGAVGDQVITAGGNTTLIAMAQMFSTTANFAAAGKIPGLTTSLSEYASLIVYYTSSTGQHIKQSYENEFDMYEQGQEMLAAIQGVNVQEEIVNLMQWQRQLKVCTQLILTAEEMLDELMRIRL